MSAADSTPGQIVLPPGVTVGPGRQTSQQTPQGTVAEGMIFPITLPGGSTTTIFVPYSMISDTGYVQQLFMSRISAIQAIAT